MARSFDDASSGVQSELHPYVRSYKRMLAAFNQNDLALVRELLSDDLVYTLPGRSSLAGTTHGLEAHLRMLKEARERSEGTLQLTPQALAVDGDFLFVWGEISAQRRGRSLRAPHCVIFRFHDGKIVEGRTVPTDLYAFDAFWDGEV